MELEKPKIGAPAKGGEKKQQVTISVATKVVALLGKEKIRALSEQIINAGYKQALKEKN